MNIPAVDRTVQRSDNQPPDYYAETTRRITKEFEPIAANVTALLDEARKLPKVIEDEATALKTGELAKRIAELASNINEKRIAEGEQHLQIIRAANDFFFGLIDRLKRRDKKAAPGAVDVLDNRITDYQERVFAAAEAARKAAAAEAERLAREAAEAAAKAAREAAEAQAAADRARNPDRREEKAEVAEQKSGVAVAAASAAEEAASQATAAHIATLAKPSEMVRASGEGVTLGMGTETYAIVEDRNKLDKAALWPFFTDDEIDRALRKWARNTGHTVQMAGAAVGKRRKGTRR